MQKTFLLIIIVIFGQLLSCNRTFAQEQITIGMGNYPGVTVTASSGNPIGIRTLQQNGYLPNQSAASRFLSQATFGADSAEIKKVAEQGFEKWLDDQLNLPNTFSLKDYVSTLHQLKVDSMNRTPPGDYTLNNVNVNDWYFDVAWFQGSVTAADLLRWRVAFALSETFVVSRTSSFGNNPYALASYYDVLMKNAFGNYRTLIDSVTYHPSMAVYLTYMNNHATNVVGKIFPDENYAREVMQLFSVGLYELNNDGTTKTDAAGELIPTYGNNDIADLAKVFTGLSWGDSQYLGDRSKDIWSYTKRLKFFPVDSSDAIKRPWKTNPTIVDGHEYGAKTFLGNTIPARPIAQGEQDIHDALDILSNHSNVAPFISRRLIQRLVTSNPSPEYVNRIATVFNNNGSGVRGDLKAVVKAILLDTDARSCECSEKPFSGMLREPFVRYMNLVRGLDLEASGGVFRNRMNEVYNQTEQRPLNSPSVFNFFLPDYIPDGALKEAEKYGPEFQLLNSQTLTGYLNALNEWIVNNDPIDYSSYFSGEKNKPDERSGFDFSKYHYLTKDNRITELIDKFNLVLAHGRLSQKSTDVIKSVVMQMPYAETDGQPRATEASRRIQMVLFLIMASPDYLINR
ncbi:MAG: DUF1800 domain-containing protein [Spirosomataceae bacterium]|jgi:uncharacterized protein (DUF1800 family)